MVKRRGKLGGKKAQAASLVLSTDKLGHLGLQDPGPHARDVFSTWEQS